MRFVCDKCETRYTIPDEKVRGRALKVRCKKCGNVISIKPEPLAAPEPAAEPVAEATQMVNAEDMRRLQAALRQSGELGNAATDPAVVVPPGDVLDADPDGPPTRAVPGGYYAIVEGEQVGPLGPAELERHLATFTVTARSYIWREDLSDWKRLEDVAELAAHLPSREAAKPPVVEPPPKAVAVEASQRGVANLDALFGDDGPDLPGRLEEGSAPPVASSDPFASVPDSPDLVAPAAPGEMTRFVIMQSGVGKQKSPWRIAAFAGAAVSLLASLVFLLSRLGFNVPLISQGHAAGERHFMGPGSGAGLDLLEARAKAKVKAPAPVGPVRGAHPTETGPLAHKESQHVDKLDASQRAALRSLYAKQGTGDLKISAASQGAAAQAIDRPDAPLTAAQVSATVAHFQTGYNMCVNRELKRNPGFHGGKIRIVTTITGSGLVREAQIESDDASLARRLGGTPLGGCLIDQTRRMVFPSFSGDPFDAEIPLVLGASM